MACLPGRPLPSMVSSIFTTAITNDVVEVRNPKPFDPDRKESNEANINKPLRFGSRTSITTAGNWG